MKHTPYGYEIVDGKAVIKEDEAENVRKICENYLSGMALVDAAADVGLEMKHSGVKNMMLNDRYLGDSFYPQILSEETVRRVKRERKKRELILGRERQETGKGPVGTVYTKFSIPEIPIKYKEAVKQAEYAYSLIESEV